uniref:DNA helicase n=1 Tax=Chromera velia CCMP2878 TaxID=1169474 RepID=A0A0G4HFS7_9ALVE|eukprot:Cvel_26992.t1-p1 / transcript=Cvel_26992.t1 / gene=Cvel_26992 / organism=Chromera_velia_CCMP2878 / gene_product=DNA-binding protein SMUBP-2, putative / transcript_product=DNA-binding protein SMUBP-2, putative / location=Cvel_scaffold3298:5479-13568(+) / protein_length=1212 / sequence_SO=supercontig / SO=protein_coding / is_pseudo=false
MRRGEVERGTVEEFVKATGELLKLESAAEIEECEELLKQESPKTLEEKGLVLQKLEVASVETGLYGRVLVTLQKRTPPGLKEAPLLPAHKFSHGAIVGVFSSQRPLSSLSPVVDGVVHRVRPGSVTVALGKGAEEGKESDGLLGEGLEEEGAGPLTLAIVGSRVTTERHQGALRDLAKAEDDSRHPAAYVVGVCFGRFRPRFHSDSGRPPPSGDAEEGVREDGGAVALDAYREAGGVDGEGEGSRTCFGISFHIELNGPQRNAVCRAMDALDVSCIHGPPGTGKTTTVVEVILQAVKRKQKVLATAPSNVAVDNLMERVIAAGVTRVCRLGHPSRISEAMAERSLDALVRRSEASALAADVRKDMDSALRVLNGKGPRGGARPDRWKVKEELRSLRQELRKRERDAVREVLRGAQVVFATCVGADNVDVRRHLVSEEARDCGCGFDLAVVDEAAQALEVSCWIPMLMAPKSVLAGDHMQLSPTVKSPEAERGGLGRTLFAALNSTWGEQIFSLLEIQYRMNVDIMDWSSSTFYEGKLRAAESVAQRRLSDLLPPDEKRMFGGNDEAEEEEEESFPPVVWIDSGQLPFMFEDAMEQPDQKGRAGGGKIEGVSRGNAAEATVVVKYLELLEARGVRRGDVNVITPYNRQVESIRSLLTEKYGEGAREVAVNTVDSFQGRENEVVLLSLVRCNRNGSIGFLGDTRRLNVAVTRARRHLCVVGDSETISHERSLAALFSLASERGRVLLASELVSEEEVPLRQTVSVSGGGASGMRPERKKEGEKEGVQRQQGKAKAKERAPAGKGKGNEKSEVGGETGRGPDRDSLADKERERQQEKAERRQLFNKKEKGGAGGGRVETEAKDSDEEERDHFRNQLKDLIARNEKAIERLLERGRLEEGGERPPLSIRFPPSLNGRQRKMLHELGEELNLVHESRGEGVERSLEVRCRPLPSLLRGKMGKGANEGPFLDVRGVSAEGRTGDEEDRGSGRKQDASSFSALGRDSREIAGEEDEEDEEEEDQERNVRTQEETEEAEELGDGDEEGQGSFSASSSSAAASSPVGAAVSSNPSKKKNKKKKKKNGGGGDDGDGAPVLEDDDAEFDALISEVSQANWTCSLPSCNASTRTLGRHCAFCNRRFCFSHAVAEAHGCRDAACKKAKEDFREAATRDTRGIANVNPSYGNCQWKKDYVRRQLEKKLDEAESKRKPKAAAAKKKK